MQLLSVRWQQVIDTQRQTAEIIGDLTNINSCQSTNDPLLTCTSPSLRMFKGDHKIKIFGESF